MLSDDLAFIGLAEHCRVHGFAFRRAQDSRGQQSKARCEEVRRCSDQLGGQTHQGNQAVAQARKQNQVWPTARFLPKDPTASTN